MAISDYLQELINQKSLLAQNLTTKGVEASSSETFNTLVAKVLNITEGSGSTPTVDPWYILEGKTTGGVTGKYNSTMESSITEFGPLSSNGNRKIKGQRIPIVFYRSSESSMTLAEAHSHNFLSNVIIENNTLKYNLGNSTTPIIEGWSGLSHASDAEISQHAIDMTGYTESTYVLPRYPDYNIYNPDLVYKFMNIFRKNSTGNVVALDFIRILSGNGEDVSIERVSENSIQLTPENSIGQDPASNKVLYQDLIRSVKSGTYTLSLGAKADVARTINVDLIASDYNGHSASVAKIVAALGTDWDTYDLEFTYDGTFTVDGTSYTTEVLELQVQLGSITGGAGETTSNVVYIRDFILYGNVPLNNYDIDGALDYEASSLFKDYLINNFSNDGIIANQSENNGSISYSFGLVAYDSWTGNNYAYPLYTSAGTLFTVGENDTNSDVLGNIGDLNLYMNIDDQNKTVYTPPVQAQQFHLTVALSSGDTYEWYRDVDSSASLASVLNVECGGDPDLINGKPDKEWSDSPGYRVTTFTGAGGEYYIGLEDLNNKATYYYLTTGKGATITEKDAASVGVFDFGGSDLYLNADLSNPYTE